MMQGVAETDVPMLKAYGVDQAAQYYNDEEAGNTDEMGAVVAKYANAEWDFEHLNEKMRLAMRCAMAFNPEEFEGNVEEAEGKSITAMFGASGELDGDNPTDYASVVACKLWGESLGMFDEMTGFEMFENVLCPSDNESEACSDDDSEEDDSEDEYHPNKRSKTE